MGDCSRGFSPCMGGRPMGDVSLRSQEGLSPGIGGRPAGDCSRDLSPCMGDLSLPLREDLSSGMGGRPMGRSQEGFSSDRPIGDLSLPLQEGLSLGMGGLPGDLSLGLSPGMGGRIGDRSLRSQEGLRSSSCFPLSHEGQDLPHGRCSSSSSEASSSPSVRGARAFRMTNGGICSSVGSISVASESTGTKWEDKNVFIAS